MTPTQRAVGIPEYGGPGVLRVIRRSIPVPGPGDVLVRVAAAPVTPTDRMLRAGLQSASLKDIPFPYTPGMEFAGVVEAVGAGVDRYGTGDRVAGIVNMRTVAGGSHAEYVAVDKRSLAMVPESLDLAVASCLPMSGITAALALDALRASRASSVFVTGASGVVGGLALQLARWDGYQPVADRPDFRSIDAVIDAAALGPETLPWIRDGGTLIAVRSVPTTDDRVRVEMVSALAYQFNSVWLQELVDLAAAGVLTPKVVHRLPLESASSAHLLAEQRGLGGRVVLLPNPGLLSP